MANKDYFDNDYTISFDTDAYEQPAPASQPQPAADETAELVEPAETLNYAGFSSTMPFLLEPPAHQLNRLQTAVMNIIVPQGRAQWPDDDKETRVLYSPAMSLPVPLMYEGDMLANEAVAHYPFLYAPANHQSPDEGQDVDEYFLTLYILYTCGELIVETPEGDLLAPDMAFNEPVEEDAWRTAADMAHRMKPLLTRLNLGRAIMFTWRDPDKEQGALETLLTLWKMNGCIPDGWDGSTALDDAQLAAEQLEPYYKGLLGDTAVFDPFTAYAPLPDDEPQH